MEKDTWKLLHLCSYAFLLAALPWGWIPIGIAFVVVLLTAAGLLLHSESQEGPPVPLGGLKCPRCNSELFWITTGGGGQDPAWILAKCPCQRMEARGLLADFFRWQPSRRLDVLCCR